MMPSFLSSSFCTIFASSPTDTNVDTFMDFQKKPLDVENSTLSSSERESWKYGKERRCTGARWVVACEGTKKSACLQFVLQGGMKAKGGGMGSKGPRASERAFPMCRNITLGFPGKRDYGTAVNRAQRRMGRDDGDERRWRRTRSSLERDLHS